MTELYLQVHPYKTGHKTRIPLLHQEARDLHEPEDNPFANTPQLIEAYERELRALTQLQPRRISKPKRQTTFSYQDVPTTELPRLH